MRTKRGDKSCHAAGCDQCGFFAEFCGHAVDKTVKHCGIAEHDTVSHTFDGVLSDCAFRNIEADPRKLGCIGNEGV